MSPGESWGKVFWAERTAYTKASKQEQTWHVGGETSRLLWLNRSECQRGRQTKDLLQICAAQIRSADPTQDIRAPGTGTTGGKGMSQTLWLPGAPKMWA